MKRKGRVLAVKKQLHKRIKSIIKSPLQSFQKFCYYIGLTVVVSTAGFLAYAIYFTQTLPELNNMSFAKLKTITQTKISAHYENKKRKHRWVSLKDVSRDFLYTVVMSEDAQFFEHSGVEFDNILASAALNIKEGKYSHGASTISQQVVKNIFLSNQKTISRKLKEVLITQDLERYFSKNEILELYLNLAEFGPDLYGARSAAWHFFRKRPAKINAAEGAFMSLMLPSPRKNHYSIFQNHNLTLSKKKKIRRVLRDMLHQEFISLKQFKRYSRYNYFTIPRRAIARKKKKKSGYSY